LQTHADDSIALQSAWREVALTVPEDEPRASVRPDREKLLWFLGFLEGRARVRAPQWWADSLLDSRANRRDNIYAGGKTESLYESYHDAGLDQVRTPRNTSLTRKGDQIVLQVGTDSCPIPTETLEKARTENGEEFVCNVSAFMSPLRCFVAVHGDWGWPHDLTCFERPSGKLLWKSRVWGTRWGDFEGQSSMCVAVVVHDSRVLVFGLSGGMNVEAFRIEDGKNLFRFATTY
jgi:hypothetical protein